MKNRKTITAKYIGANDRGYINGQSYTLVIKFNKPGVSDALAFNIFVDPPVVITRLDNSGICPYSSLENFFENWTDIKTT